MDITNMIELKCWLFGLAGHQTASQQLHCWWWERVARCSAFRWLYLMLHIACTSLSIDLWWFGAWKFFFAFNCHLVMGRAGVAYRNTDLRIKSDQCRHRRPVNRVWRIHLMAVYQVHLQMICVQQLISCFSRASFHWTNFSFAPIKWSV